MSKAKLKKLNIDEKKIVYAIAEGAVSKMDVTNGKFIPVIIIDTENNKDINDAIIFQGNSITGKLTTMWIRGKNLNFIGLLVSFTNPIEKEFIILFDLKKFSAVIDLIVETELLYLQPGKKDETVKNTIENFKLLIEVPSDYFKNDWKEILKKCIYKNKYKMSNKQKKEFYDNFYSEWQKFSKFRFNRKSR